MTILIGIRKLLILILFSVMQNKGMAGMMGKDMAGAIDADGRAIDHPTFIFYEKDIVF